MPKSKKTQNYISRDNAQEKVRNKSRQLILDLVVRSQYLKKRVTAYLTQRHINIKNRYLVIKKQIIALPAIIKNWIKSRPSVIRHWIVNDRKKKKYRSFRLQKKIQPDQRNIPSVTSLFFESIKLFLKNWRLFTVIMSIYIVVYIIAIRAPFITDSRTVLDTVNDVVGSTGVSGIKENLAALGAILGTSGGRQNPIAVSVSTLLMSLVYIWATRQITAGVKIKARDAYFQSMTPLMSIVTLLLLVSVQLLPFGLASFVYSTARNNSLFISGYEDLGFFIVVVLFGLLSLYWVSTSIIAIYVATLPGMYPVKAFQIASNLVRFQKFKIFKRLFVLPIFSGLLYVLALALTIQFLPNLTLYVAEFLQIAILPIVNIYLFKLYRSLL
jgi:hypothetical protein